MSGDDLREADGQLGRLLVDDARRQQLTIAILRAALDWCTTGAAGGAADARLRAEPACRSGSGWNAATGRWPGWRRTHARRIELVDMANDVRPRTLA